jgi:hypothetical protein
MYVEEIYLSADGDDRETDQSPEDPQTAAVLEQANGMRQCRSEFTLFNNHRLSVKTQGFMQNVRDYTVDIGILDPQPKRSLKVCWSHLLIFAGLGGAAWLCSTASFASKSMLLSMILSVCAAVSLILAIYRSHDRLVFYSQYGRVPLVVLFNRLPDRVTLDAFTDALVQNIKNAKTHSRETNETLSEELKEHRRLMEEGVISKKRYDIAKRRILGQHGSGGR